MNRNKPLKRKTRLKPMSDKRKIENTTYKLHAEEYKLDQISKNGYWQCCFRGRPYAQDDTYGTTCDEQGRCIMIATDIHHRMGRGKYLTWKKYFLGLCRWHHLWTEANKKEARKRKLILYK